LEAQDHLAGKYGRIMEVAELYMDRISTKVMIEISFIYIRVQNLQIDGLIIASAGDGKTEKAIQTPIHFA
jgi:hypothetical protein